MLEILLLFAAGILLGRLFRGYKLFNFFSKYVSLTICLLIFVLGFSVGSNDAVIDELDKVLTTSVVLSVCGFIGSVSAVVFMTKLFFKKG